MSTTATATATTTTSSTIHDRSITPARDAGGRRVIEGAGFVVVWMALGYAFSGNDLVYLLMGVPLTIAFQLLVRQRPLRELWVRDATRFTLDKRGLVLASLLVVAPVFYGARALPGASGWLIGWYAAAIVGAAGAAFALRATDAVAMLRAALVPMAVGAGGMAAVLGGIHIATDTPVHVLTVLGTVAKYLLLYFPLTFLIEEVAFRGALDAHVHHAGEGRAWRSALFVSALWGLWHLPISGGLPLPLLVLELLVVHCLIGVPLSFAWRRTRNLAGPAFAHSAIDAVRNALMLGL
jgi:hypothetical protein